MYCSTTSQDRRGVRREVTVRWEQETGDFGTILSSYPVFDLDSECEGPEDYYDEVGPNGGIQLVPERRPDRCPFAMEDDYHDNPEVVAVLAAMRERHEFKRLLDGRPALDTISRPLPW